VQLPLQHCVPVVHAMPFVRQQVPDRHTWPPQQVAPPVHGSPAPRQQKPFSHVPLQHGRPGPQAAPL
jgi:hypothetical protein